MARRFNWKVPTSGFAWSNVEHLRDTVGKRTMKYRAEDLPEGLRIKRDERVVWRWIKWFHSKHKPLDREEAEALLRAFAHYSEETPLQLASYFFKACGKNKQASVHRMDLIGAIVKEAVTDFEKSNARKRLGHHIRTGLTVAFGLPRLVVHEIRQIKE